MISLHFSTYAMIPRTSCAPESVGLTCYKWRNMMLVSINKVEIITNVHFCRFIFCVDQVETATDSDTESRSLREYHSVGVQVEDDKRYVQQTHKKYMPVFLCVFVCVCLRGRWNKEMCMCLWSFIFPVNILLITRSARVAQDIFDT